MDGNFNEDGGHRNITVLKRVVSRMDVALSIVFSLSGFGASMKPFNILDLHPQSIVATYLIAVGLRDFLLNQDMVAIEEEEEVEINSSRTPDAQKTARCKEIWQQFKPNRQTLDRVLKRVLRINSEHYRNVHVEDYVKDGNEHEGSGGGDKYSEISRRNGNNSASAIRKLPAVINLIEEDDDDDESEDDRPTGYNDRRYNGEEEDDEDGDEDDELDDSGKNNNSLGFKKAGAFNDSQVDSMTEYRTPNESLRKRDELEEDSE